jgi:hypothetical protein
MRLPYGWEIRDWWDDYVLPMPKRPGALTMEEWGEYHERTTKAHPFRHWLHSDLPIFASIWKRRLIHDPYWWVRHRLPPHRYNILHTGLKPGYYDPDTRFLHAIMEEVCSYVKITEETVDRTWQPEKWAPLLATAEWWPRYKQWSDTQYDSPLWEEARKAHEAGDREASHRAYMKLNEIEERWEQEADDYLVAIMKVRRGIWYP